MQEVALYRKYRPENFDNAIGQEHVIRVLRNAILEDKISHAYLFSGPRGTGKTSVARILAKAINCENKKSYNPCGKCTSCKGIKEGKILDLIEIDAASNRGIDEIRDLREKVKFSPTDCKYKVFIIDEVHMLTKEAFNALLKTLEEPPSHAIFILATTEINKVPTTILSRCQRHDFRRIKLGDIFSVLSNIRDSEKINISDDALEMVAENSDGGLRDAISILDQLASIGIKKIETKDVEDTLGLAPHKAVLKFVVSLLDGKNKNAINAIISLNVNGTDLVIFTRSAQDFLRKIISVKVAGSESIEGTKEQIEELEKVATKFDISQLIKLSESLMWAQGTFRTGVEQIAILTIVAASNYGEENTVKQNDESNEILIREEIISDSKKSKNIVESSKNDKRTNGQWHHFLMDLKVKNNTIHAFMRVANPIFSDNKVTLTFPYKFHKEKMQEPKNRQIVEDILRKVYGTDYIIECILDSNSGGKNSISDAGSAASILGGEVQE